MNPTTILYIALALIIGFGAGYLVFKGAPSTGISSGIKQAPILKSNWDNKAISAWQAVVSGTLSARNESSFVLNSNGSLITLPLAPGTTFGDPRDPDRTVNFTAIPVGTVIKGVVNVDREKGIFGSGNYRVQFE